MRHAACSGSTPTIAHVRACSALTTVPMPAIRPPPPTGTTIASTSGVCSRISSAHRALAGDHVGVVERMDEREAVARGDLSGVRARLGQVGAVQDDVARRAAGSWSP